MLTIKKIVFPLLVVLHIVCRFIWADVHDMSITLDQNVQKKEVAYQNFLHEHPTTAKSLKTSNVEGWQIDKLVYHKREAYIPQISLLVD